MKRIATLDGWRGIAISMVLVDHARFSMHIDPSASMSTGPHGVTLFFVLSGFLITSRLAAEKQSTGSIDLRRFYVRRFFRLMPAAWTFLWFALIYTVFSPGALVGLFNIVAALLFFRNYSYLLAPGPALTGHFWTLSIEEQFYIVWPSILVLTGSRMARWVALSGAVLIGIYRFAHWSSLASLSFEPAQATQLHADSLLLGCAAALFLPRIRPYLRDWMVIPLLIALVPCIANYHLLIPLRESIILALLLAITSSSESKAFAILNWKPVAFLGTISYSLYLWQQPFTSYGHIGPRHLLFAAVALPCFALGSYYLIEKPFIDRPYRKCLDVVPATGTVASGVDSPLSGE
jgi:peptidoglycan/LPS O-acetylase OafA/YrhL